MPVVCRLPSGSGGSGSGGTSSDLSLNIFTQSDEPDISDGVWVQTSNRYSKVVIANAISTDGEWSDVVGTLPTSFSAYNKPVLFNGKMYIVDSMSYGTYTFDGSSWTRVGDGPGIGTNIQLIVYNNELYCFGGDGSLSGYDVGKGMCKWTGNSWSSYSVISVDCSVQDSLLAYNGYVYWFGPNLTVSPQCSELWRFNGSTFTKMITTDYVLTNNGLNVAYNSVAYWMIDYYNNTTYDETNNAIASYTGGSSISFLSSSTPFSNENDYCVSAVVHDGSIHMILGFSDSSRNYTYKHYKWNGSVWTYMFTMTQALWLCPIGTALYAFGDEIGKCFSKTLDKYAPNTLILHIASTHDGSYETAFVNTGSLISGNDARLTTKFNDVYYIGDSGANTSDPIYYGNGTQWVKLKN